MLDQKLQRQWEMLDQTFTIDGNGSDVDTKAFTQFFLNNYDAFESTIKSSVTKGKALNLYQDVIKKKTRLARLGNADTYLNEIIKRARIYVNIIGLSHLRINDPLLYQDVIKKKTRLARLGNADTYLNEIIKRARIYVNIIGLSHLRINDPLLEDPTIQQLLANLQQLESTQAYPLLLFLFVDAERLGLDVMKMRTILRAFVSFYVRRNITEVPKSSNIRAMLINLIREISADNLRGDIIVNRIVHELKAKGKNDEDFGKEILQRPLYDQTPKTTRFVLIDLEHALEEANDASLSTKERPIDLNNVLENGKPRWSIEHILPQGSLPKYWQQMITPEHLEEAEDLQKEYTHRIGNLTLTAYNENMHQKPFADPEHPATQEDTHYNLSKRDYKDNGEYVGMRSQLQINTSIPQVGERIEDKTSWTIDDITRRSEWFRDEMTHRIGNLTLTAYNENMHQKPFADPEHPATQEDTHYNLSKRDYKDNGEYVGMRSQLQINTSIPQVGERIEDKTSWTIDDITRRSEWFRDEMLKRYRFPDID